MLNPLHLSYSFQGNLSNVGCNNNKLCVNEPGNCEPSTGSCTFISAKQKEGQNFEFELAGESDGYIAAVVSGDETLVCWLHTTQSNMDLVIEFGIISINMVCVLFYILQGDNDITYICFNNNSKLSFTGAKLKNTQLTQTPVRD